MSGWYSLFPYLCIMRNLHHNLLLILFVLVGSSAMAQIKVLPVNDFDSKLTATVDKIILDVRTPEEYSSGHLKDAQLANYRSADFKQQVEKLDHNKPVFVYCAAGVRSHAAAEVLTGLGFTQVYDLDGGMNAWKGAKKEVIK